MPAELQDVVDDPLAPSFRKWREECPGLLTCLATVRIPVIHGAGFIPWSACSPSAPLRS
ncbi:hypothetical protein [Streptomyces sp. NBC_00829]|uniref:hypothetical protein n=1 Tax=Streptomyces sp. NBC_00829 TaxID=2903679 RepID=UPI00386A278B|nr:hypothetical protein OG293_23920 [Streptomyces sp. NBC_00829]